MGKRRIRKISADHRRRGNRTLSICASRLVFGAAFVVLSLHAVLPTGTLRYAHSVLGFGFAAVAGLSGRHAVRILLGNSRVSSLRVVGRSRAIGALGDPRSIPSFGGATIGGLSRRDAVRVLVGDSSVASLRINSSGSLTTPANGFTTQSFDAILMRKHTRSKQHTH
jgi:hypothetical protein